MKVIPVTEAASQLGKLVTDALSGEAIILTIGAQQVQLTPRADAAPEIDFNSPELRDALLAGLEGEPQPYSHEETRKACEEAVRKRKGF